MNNITELNTNLEMDSEIVEKESFMDILFKKILLPVKSGMVGFTIILSILALRELYLYLVGAKNIFALDIFDVLLSSIGFICLFLLYYLKNHNKSI